MYSIPIILIPESNLSANFIRDEYIDTISQYIIKIIPLESVASTIKSDPIDLILFDCQILQGNGLEIMESIKDVVEREKIALLFMSNSTASKEKMSQLKLNTFVDFVLKPIPQKLLLDKINQLLKQSIQRYNAPYVFGTDRLYNSHNTIPQQQTTLLPPQQNQELVFILDKNHTVVQTSNQVLPVGATLRRFYQLCYKEDILLIQEQIKLMEQNPIQHKSIQLRLRSFQSEVHWIQLDLFPIQNNGQTLDGIYCYCKPISEQKTTDTLYNMLLKIKTNTFDQYSFKDLCATLIETTKASLVVLTKASAEQISTQVAFTSKDQIVELSNLELINKHSLCLHQGYEQFNIKQNCLFSSELNLKVKFFIGHPIYQSNGVLKGHLILYFTKQTYSQQLLKHILHLISSKISSEFDRQQAESKITSLLTQTQQQNNLFKEFSFITSHNIKSMVANIQGLLPMLEAMPDNPEIVEYIKAATNQLNTTINHTTELLNVEVKGTPPTYKEYNLAHNVQNIINSLYNRKSASPVNFNIDIPADIKLHVIPAYMDSILTNLISNALKFGITDTANTINIVATQTIQQTTITVKDFGIGFDTVSDAQHKIFKVGSRLHAGYPGLGLGLYITKRQIQAMEGQITVSSTPNQGAEFKIIL